MEMFECVHFSENDPTKLRSKVDSYLRKHPDARAVDIIVTSGEYDYQDVLAENVGHTILGFCRMINDLMRGRR